MPEQITPEQLREWADDVSDWRKPNPTHQVCLYIADYLRSQADRLTVDDTEIRAALAQSEARAGRLEKALRAIEQRVGLERAVVNIIDTALAADPPKPKRGRK